MRDSSTHSPAGKLLSIGLIILLLAAGIYVLGKKKGASPDSPGSASPGEPAAAAGSAEIAPGESGLAPFFFPRT